MNEDWPAQLMESGSKKGCYTWYFSTDFRVLLLLNRTGLELPDSLYTDPVIYEFPLLRGAVNGQLPWVEVLQYVESL